MPDLDLQKKANQTPVVTDAVAGPQTTSSRDQLRQRAGATDYAGGQELLSPNATPPEKKADEKSPEEKEKEREAAARKGYEEALGNFLGGKLYEVLHKELGPDKLLKYGKDGISKLPDLAGVIKPTEAGALGGIMDEASEAAAVKAFSAELLKWAGEEATKWIEGDDGKSLLKNVNNWIEGHPKTIAISAVTGALIAAAAAYAANVDIPKLGTDFKLAKGLKGNVSVDLGKIQQLCVQSAEAGLAYESEVLKASGTVKYERIEKDKDVIHKGTVSANVSSGPLNAEASASADTAGNKGVGLKLGYDAKTWQLNGDATAEFDKENNLKLDTGLLFKRDDFSSMLRHRSEDLSSAQVTSAEVQFGEKADRWKVSGEYDWSKQDFTLGTSRTRLFEGDKYKLSLNESVTGKGTSQSVTGDFGVGKYGSLGINATNENGQTTKGGVTAKYERDWFKSQLDFAMENQKSSLGGKVEATHGNYSASGDFKLDLDESRLQSLSLKLGYRDPTEFKAWLVEYSRSWSDTNKGYEDKLHGMVETSIGKVMLRGDATATMQSGDLKSLGVEGLAGYQLNKDWTAIGGARYDMDAMGKGRATIEAGVQFRKVPIVIGYTPETNGWTVGVRIPFGR